MKKVVTAVLLAATASFGSAVEVGTGIWQQSLGGSFNAGALTTETLGLEGSNDLYFYATIDMPLIIPNLKIRSQSLTASGSGLVDPDAFGGFGGLTTTGGAAVPMDTSLDLSYLDVVAHYGLPLPAIDVDFGLNARLINGSITIHSDSAAVDETGALQMVIPMLHSSINIPLPANLSLYGEYNLLPMGSVNVSDTLIKARYVLPVPTLIVDLGIELGYHDFTMTVTEPSDMASDLSSKGLFVGVVAEF